MLPEVPVVSRILLCRRVAVMVDTYESMGYIFSLAGSCIAPDILCSECVPVSSFVATYCWSVRAKALPSGWSALSRFCPPHSSVLFKQLLDLVQCSINIPVNESREYACPLLKVTELQSDSN